LILSKVTIIAAHSPFREIFRRLLLPTRKKLNCQRTEIV